jgi:hypothetical protein
MPSILYLGFFRISHRAKPEPRHRVHGGKDKLVQFSVLSVSELCVLCGKKLIDKIHEGVPKLLMLLHTSAYPVDTSENHLSPGGAR